MNDYSQSMNELDTVAVGDGWRQTVHGFAFMWQRVRYLIPLAFRFNGLSVPRLLHWWEAPWGEWTLIPAAIHDYLYDAQTTTRHSADRCFYVSLCRNAFIHYPVTATGSGLRNHMRRRYQRRLLAIKLRRARMMYHAVRRWGGAYWIAARMDSRQGRRR